MLSVKQEMKTPYIQLIFEKPALAAIKSEVTKVQNFTWMGPRTCPRPYRYPPQFVIISIMLCRIIRQEFMQKKLYR